LITLKIYIEQGSSIKLWPLSAGIGAVGVGVMLITLALYLRHNSKVIEEEAKQRSRAIETENPEDIIEARQGAMARIIFCSLFFIPLYLKSLPLDYTDPSYLSQLQGALISPKAVVGHVFFALGLIYLGKYIHYRFQLSPAEEVCLPGRQTNLISEENFWSNTNT
jgi:hypothetical protein